MRVAPVGVDGRGRALVGLASADGVPNSSESDAGNEDDAGVVHGLEVDGDGGGHAEERDGQCDPGWEFALVCVFLCSLCGAGGEVVTYRKK